MPRAASPALDRPAIAVLPFTNMSGEPEQEYFSDGISEDLITALSKLRWFLVIARNSSFIYKGKSVHLRQVAEELGVRYVVEGSVRKSGDRVRITAQLNDVVSGSHIWAEKYDRALTDVFAVQDEITERIVFSIQPQLYGAESFRAQRKPPENLDAWDLVMRALSHYWRVTRADHLVAQAFLEKAIAIDPEYGRALGLLASSYMFTAHMGWIDLRSAMAPAESAPRRPPSAWTTRTPGRMSPSAMFISSRGGSTTRWPSSRRRCGSIRTSRWRSAITGFRSPIAGAGRRRTRSSAGRCASARVTLIRRCMRAFWLTRSFSAAITRRRSGCRTSAIRQRSDFVGAHRVLAACRGHGGRRRSRRRRSGGVPPRAAEHLARLDPRRKCRSSWKPDRAHYLEGFRRAGLT